jgi:hypothetical protein
LVGDGEQATLGKGESNGTRHRFGAKINDHAWTETRIENHGQLRILHMRGGGGSKLRQRLRELLGMTGTLAWWHWQVLPGDFFELSGLHRPRTESMLSQ